MKLDKISQDIAEKIIVYGNNKSFSTFVFKGKSYTIYHREYDRKHYDILEMITNNGDIEITTFYELDPNEVKELFKI